MRSNNFWTFNCSSKWWPCKQHHTGNSWLIIRNIHAMWRVYTWRKYSTCCWTILNLTWSIATASRIHLPSFQHPLLFILKFLLPHPYFGFNNSLFLLKQQNIQVKKKTWLRLKFIMICSERWVKTIKLWHMNHTICSMPFSSFVFTPRYSTA